MDETKTKILKYFGEFSVEMAYNYFFRGWLFVGDK